MFQQTESEWFVYSTAVDEHVLLVKCRKTGRRGYVENPTVEEWGRAFHAPSNPFLWTDQGRVIIDDNTAPPFEEATKQKALDRLIG